MIPPLVNEREIPDLIRLIEKNSYKFDCPIKEKSDEWEENNKSEFIYGIFKFYPMGSPIICYEDKENFYIVDGQKRLKCIVDFKNNKFALPSNLPEYEYFDNNAFPNVIKLTSDISCKTFDELPPALQEIFLYSCFTLLIYDSEYYTESEMQEIYRRSNL